MSARILLVEDNTDLAAGIAYNLELEGYDVRVAENGVDALHVFAQWTPDLVLLDLMLPGMDGYRILQSIRGIPSAVPVIILTAKSEEADKVRGFRLDADQYVTKPFGILELLERIAALLRRSARGSPAPSDTRAVFGDVIVDLAAHTVARAGKEVQLTPMAFRLLAALIERRGAVASRVDLLREVWGYDALVMTRTVDSHIAELRRKLDDPDEPRHIVTVWKVGYRLVA